MSRQECKNEQRIETLTPRNLEIAFRLKLKTKKFFTAKDMARHLKLSERTILNIASAPELTAVETMETINKFFEGVISFYIENVVEDYIAKKKNKVVCGRKDCNNKFYRTTERWYFCSKGCQSYNSE